MLAALCVTASLILSPPAARAEELHVGQWTIAYGKAGVASVQFGDMPVLGALTVGVFRPDYRGSHFALSDAEVKHEQAGGAERLVFAQEAPGKVKCTATLDIKGNTLRWSVAMEMAVEGHLEVCVPVPNGTVETPNGDLFYSLEGADQEIVTGHTAPVLYPKGELRLKTLTSDLVVRPDPEGAGWVFQDRRAEESLVRLVGCVNPDGKQVLRTTPAIEITVEPLSPADANARRLILGQRRATRTDVTVKNAGFEDPEPLAGWSHDTNARVVADQPAEGKACARLDVAKPDDAVYLTQQVPVTPGSRYQISCRIRTENVKQDGRMRMSSVGACLIHEWAGPDGQWLLPGSYSPGLLGTNGWTHAECDEPLAPQGVGYAIIFLACRALGTTYFDDVRMVEIKPHSVILSPLDGATLADNRPVFRWRLEPVSTTYTVECRGERGGFSAKTGDTSYRPPDRMEPGRYEWQVTGDGAAPSVKWAFTQTAPVTADTTGPDLSAAAQSFTEGSGFLPLKASDSSGLDLGKVSLRVAGHEAPAEVRAREGGLEVRPRAGWPRGATEVEVSVPDRAGNVSTAQVWVLNTPAPPKSYTWTYDRGVSDGKRCFLPLGMYQVPTEEMPRVKQAGFNLVHTYQFEGSQDDAAARKYLDAAQANGLQVFIGFDRGLYSGAGLIQMNLGHVARRIGALRDHPALLAWYLFDEPDGSSQYVSPKNLRALYQLIHSLDPYHPVIVTFASDSPVKQYGKCYDVHWTQVYGPTSYVRDRILLHRTMLEGRPLAAILHCFDRRQSELVKSGQPVDDAAFELDLRKFRAGVAMALALRSSGLSWWWYGDKRHQWLTAADIPQAWADLTHMVAGIHKLAPLLTAEGEELPVTLTTEPAKAPISARARKVGTRVLVIVATAEEKADSTFTLGIPGLPATARATAKFETRAVKLEGGTLSDTLEPLGRRIYEITW